MRRFHRPQAGPPFRSPQASVRVGETAETASQEVERPSPGGAFPLAKRATLPLSSESRGKRTT